MSKDLNTYESHAEGQREEDAMTETLNAGTVKMLPMNDLSSALDNMLGERNEEEEDLENLMESTPKVVDNPVFPANELEKPKIEETVDANEDEQYEESFASQRETTQLREEIESLTTELEELKSTIAGVMKEREAIPHHMTSIREDISAQMTLMMSKLSSAIESDLPSINVRAAASTLADVKGRSEDKLFAAESYARDRPRETSPLANKTSKLEGKRRFKPVE